MLISSKSFCLTLSISANASNSSSIRFVRIIPVDVSPVLCLLLPILCISLIACLGDPNCITLSILPMSNPSSRDDVHTTNIGFPLLNLVSASSLVSLDNEP